MLGVQHRLYLASPTVAFGLFLDPTSHSTGEYLRFWIHIDFLWWADWLSYRVQSAIPYQGMPFLKRLWLNLFASGIVYVLELKE
jgi:hypothetical protein